MATSKAASKSRRIREEIGHPIVDCDGHLRELVPVVRDYVVDYLRQVGGSDMPERFAKAGGLTYLGSVGATWDSASEEQRKDAWTLCPAWWGEPAKNTLDRAAVSLPQLLHERMDELGLDFAVMYASQATTLPDIQDAEVRTAAIRAYNTFYADLYRPYADRLTPAALIPMHTPEEAIREVEYVVNELGLKTIMLRLTKRAVPAIQRESSAAGQAAYRLETYGIDAAYDYDPLWQKCIELKVSPAAHATGQGWGSRRSISNYMYNHIGAFGSGAEALCKSLFMSGVTRRFPELNFAFLEGGVPWACELYASLVSHWEKRNPQALMENLSPSLRDNDSFLRYITECGDDSAKANLDVIREYVSQDSPHPEQIDDLAACEIARAEDIRDLFVPNFYFGCEADDPLNTWAFNDRVNPMGAKLRAMFSSDFGHWDVPDMEKVVEEAYELVEKGLMSAEDFRDFTFSNPVRFFGEVNRDFFKGTKLEAEAADLLSSTA